MYIRLKTFHRWLEINQNSCKNTISMRSLSFHMIEMFKEFGFFIEFSTNNYSILIDTFSRILLYWSLSYTEKKININFICIEAEHIALKCIKI